MKTDIHPKFNEQVKAVCACGAEIIVGSTQKEVKAEICSQCHPLFTGQEKVMDTAGRMEKFKARVAASSAKAATKAKKVTK